MKGVAGIEPEAPGMPLPRRENREPESLQKPGCAHHVPAVRRVRPAGVASARVCRTSSSCTARRAGPFLFPHDSVPRHNLSSSFGGIRLRQRFLTVQSSYRPLPILSPCSDGHRSQS
ncbi:hypothetical protein Sfum_0597 [Syntrophobacter fumaroxidans MPOB]|uniref:Uncharacterized protein n=1 Tax=Syntrophobacter fumaroxidans (strain DSM 10017 / MPOB) TaxID=335543 RepID=A0LFU4_SYNFM|nr:hypothetical protein Sfum_0597 [Syntrophobacter fumaroxidans MPOB]